MTTALIVLVVLVLVGYGLERNHTRRGVPHSRLAGSHDIDDRDLVRVDSDLRAVTDHQPAPLVRHRHRRALRLHRGTGLRV